MYASVIRTIVPVVVGFLLTQALRLGIHLPADTATEVVQAGLTGGYYAVVRWAEIHVSARFGWLLGLAKAPQYTAKTVGAGAAAGTLTEAGSALFASVVRTVVPVIAGFLLTQALRLGVHLPQDSTLELVQTGLTGGYYVVVRWAETHLSVRFGWLLGLATLPQYTAPKAPVAAGE